MSEERGGRSADPAEGVHPSREARTSLAQHTGRALWERLQRFMLVNETRGGDDRLSLWEKLNGVEQSLQLLQRDGVKGRRGGPGEEWQQKRKWDPRKQLERHARPGRERWLQWADRVKSQLHSH